MNCRKSLIITETVHSEAGHAAPEPVTRVAAIAVLDNPAAGRFASDLSGLADIGLAFGEALAAAAVGMLRRAPVAYGKAAIRRRPWRGRARRRHPPSQAGETHARRLRRRRGAHPLGRQGGVGRRCNIDVPLAHKDEIWSFNELDTMTVMVADAPRPDEILAVMVFSDGGRPFPRIGSSRAVV